MTADLSNLSLASPYPTMKSSKLPMVKDKAIRMMLYKGLCNNRLYPIPSLVNVYVAVSQSIVLNKALLGHLVTFTTWDNRLGHPSNSVVSLMLHKSKVAFTKESNPVMCQSCLEGKFSKLPFALSVNKSVIPFEVEHNDL
ncbi:hypothetical protein COP2_033533 [Malus domestica]